MIYLLVTCGNFNGIHRKSLAISKVQMRYCALHAFDRPRIKEDTCPVDAISELEKTIDTGSYRGAAFFQAKKKGGC